MTLLGTNVTKRGIVSYVSTNPYHCTQKNGPAGSAGPSRKPREEEQARWRNVGGLNIAATVVWRGSFIRPAPFGLFAFGSDGVGGFAVHRVVADLERGVIHAQRHDEPDHLEDDEGHDGVEHDDEQRAVELHQELMAVVAVEDPGDRHARRLFVVADVLEHVGVATTPTNRPPSRPATPCVDKT